MDEREGVEVGNKAKHRSERLKKKIRLLLLKGGSNKSEILSWANVKGCSGSSCGCLAPDSTRAFADSATSRYLTVCYLLL